MIGEVCETLGGRQWKEGKEEGGKEERRTKVKTANRGSFLHINSLVL